MWGGDYVVIDDFLAEALSEDILLGISTYIGSENIEINRWANQQDDEHYHNNTEFIIKHTALWKRLCVLDKAIAFFDYEHTQSVRYKGFLVNHTQKLAIDLGDYYKKSLSMTKNRDLYVIDPIPVLTETGGGVSIALCDGMTSITTEDLAMEWCGDLLQIVNTLPKGYECIDCCFADVWSRARFCYKEYGVDEEDFLLEQQGKRLICCRLNLHEKRSLDSFMKVTVADGKVKYHAIPIYPKGNKARGRLWK
jgi:hypothetical protein